MSIPREFEHSEFRTPEEVCGPKTGAFLRTLGHETFVLLEIGIDELKKRVTDNGYNVLELPSERGVVLSFGDCSTPDCPGAVVYFVQEEQSLWIYPGYLKGLFQICNIRKE